MNVYFFFSFSPLSILSKMGYFPIVLPNQCSSVLLDSWLQLYKCTQVNPTLLSSTHQLRIRLHISFNHDRRKQIVKQNHGDLLLTLPLCFHWLGHTFLIIMKELYIWRDCLTGFLDHCKTIRVEISSTSFITPSKYFPQIVLHLEGILLLLFFFGL